MMCKGKSGIVEWDGGGLGMREDSDIRGMVSRNMYRDGFDEQSLETCICMHNMERTGKRGYKWRDGQTSSRSSSISIKLRPDLRHNGLEVLLI